MAADLPYETTIKKMDITPGSHYAIYIWHKKYTLIIIVCSAPARCESSYVLVKRFARLVFVDLNNLR
jgi:molybdopterin biosynthesis enzyme